MKDAATTLQERLAEVDPRLAPPPCDGETAATGLRRAGRPPPTVAPFVDFTTVKNGPAVVVGVKGSF